MTTDRHTTDTHNSAPVMTEREKILACLARYCRGIDRRDPDLVRSAYWPGAIDDHVTWVGTVEAFVDWVMPLIGSMELTQHKLGQSHIEWHGDVAMVETCLTAYHRVPVDGRSRDIILGARYADRMERRGGEWRIAHRILIQDWIQDIGASIDWSKGSLGMLPLHDRGFGSGADDSSVAFMATVGKGWPVTPPTTS
ncbi:nuclear transport factor 2 family protein [Sphingobium sp. JS3065]|uniref:nuclear transport factor 2 family protein n=1 Tax=Sphingobium sp. JS3065 TaxID=2970925 RepID=UPI002265346E|nr:nuclear transport factor 2 family protein [Sphingobium sp. JS3065]UZW57050.1 nuclear transport factor 2 family protein [Sphingobium sp. JS3065]